MTSHVVTSDPTLATRTFFSLPAPQSTQVPSTLFWFIEQKSELLLHGRANAEFAELAVNFLRRWILVRVQHRLHVLIHTLGTSRLLLE